MRNVLGRHRPVRTNASGYTMLEVMISLAMVGVMAFSSFEVLSHVNRAQIQQNTTAQVAATRNSLLYELDSPATCLGKVFGAAVPAVGTVSAAVAAGGLVLPNIRSGGNSRLLLAPETRFVYTLESFQIDPRSFARPGGGAERRALGSLTVSGRHGGTPAGRVDGSELSVPIAFTFNQAMVFTGCSVGTQNFATQLNGGAPGAAGFPVRSSLECQGLGGAVFPTPERRLVCLIRNPNILAGNRDFYNNPPTAAGATACAQSGWVASQHVSTSSVAAVTPSCGGTVNTVTGSSFFSNLRPYGGDGLDTTTRIKRGTQGFDWGAGVGVAALSVAIDMTIGGLLGPLGILGGIIAGLVCGKRCRDNRPPLYPLVVTEGCI